MAVFRFSALSDGRAISFDPSADGLNLDPSAIPAGIERVIGNAFDDRIAGSAAAGTGLDSFVFAATPGNFTPGDARFASTGQLFVDAGATAAASPLIVKLLRDLVLAVTEIVVTGKAQPSPADGTSGNDSLTGTEGNDSIAGLAGDDSIDGRGGDDSLDAGTGGDLLIGGAGDDVYVVDGPGDTITENAGQGIDTVRSSASRTLDANVENLALTGSAAINGTGNSLNNVITGNSTNNVLDGAAGIDRLVGGAGNDTYIVEQRDDRVSENAGDGIDTVLSSATLHELDANVENLTLTTGGLNGWGNSLSNVIRGNSAANVLNGVTGADTLIGGAGDDTYLVDGPGDRVMENAGEGIDSVQASASHTLAANVENLLLADISAMNGTGNSLNNSISGNSIANTLAGLDGNDTLSGSGGNDSLSGGAGRDFFVFLDSPGSGGVDRVADFARGTDELLFENEAFSALGAAGAWTAGDARFRSGAGVTTGGDSSDRLVYDTSTGSLYYDADGSGSGGSHLIATFAGNPALSATDITVI